MTRFVLVAGATGTADEAARHAPSADAEVIEYGCHVRTSPRPTPAVVTRAVRELVGFETLVVDGGLAEPTGAPTVTVGASPGRDVRDADPVPTAPGAWTAARELGRALPDDELVIGESTAGGTASALGVCRALGVDAPLSPGPETAGVVRAAFESSDVDPGRAAYRPALAVRFLGDPVLAVVGGLVVGALESGTAVTLGGDARVLVVAALVRHAGAADPLTVATTPAVVEDPGTSVRATAADLDCDVVVTDPGLGDRADRLAGDGGWRTDAGLGGALVLAERAGHLDAVPAATTRVLERIDRSTDD